MTIVLHRVFGLAILYFVPQEGNSERTKKSKQTRTRRSIQSRLRTESGSTNNRSNRFEVANHARLSPSPKVAGQFWCASPAAAYRYIPQRRLPEPFQTAQRYVVKALRLTDRRAKSGSPRTASVVENGLSVSRASAIIGPCAIHMCPSACLCGQLCPTNQP